MTYQSKFAVSARTSIFSVTLAFIAIFSIFAMPLSAGTFQGSNFGPITDGGTGTPPNCTTPRDIQFFVSGQPSPIHSVSVDFTMEPAHTWIGDLQVFLIAPDSTTHTLFSRVGQQDPSSDNGDSSILSGTYTFSDLGMLNLWTAASAGGGNYLIPNGNHRTQTSGPFPDDNSGPEVTSINDAFAGVANPNGTWTLRFMDCAQADTGSVSDATLTLLGPTAANAVVTGRVTTGKGMGIRGARISVTGGNLLEPITATTSSFGHFRLQVPAGETYVISIGSKRYAFNDPTRLISVDADLAGIDFIAY